jgi:hypothetical protein
MGERGQLLYIRYMIKSKRKLETVQPISQYFGSLPLWMRKRLKKTSGGGRHGWRDANKDSNNSNTSRNNCERRWSKAGASSYGKRCECDAHKGKLQKMLYAERIAGEHGDQLEEVVHVINKDAGISAFS